MTTIKNIACKVTKTSKMKSYNLKTDKETDKTINCK